MAAKAGTSNGITLKGSVDIVTEFFGYSINRCELVCLEWSGVEWSGVGAERTAELLSLALPLSD